MRLSSPRSALFRAHTLLERVVEMSAGVAKWSVAFLEPCDQQSAFQGPDNQLRQAAGVDVAANLIFGDSLGGNFREARGPVLQRFFCAGAQSCVAIVGLH